MLVCSLWDTLYVGPKALLRGQYVQFEAGSRLLASSLDRLRLLLF